MFLRALELRLNELQLNCAPPFQRHCNQEDESSSRDYGEVVRAFVGGAQENFIESAFIFRGEISFS
jgi:hypothetical protein